MEIDICKWLKCFQDWKHNYMQWITWNYLSKFKLCCPNTIDITKKEVLKSFMEGACGIAKKVYVE